jgi:hypothetical protein
MKFAVRLSFLGLAFIMMFSVIGLRLWFVQVAQGEAIAQAAEEQAWLSKTTHAARGEIYDRNGSLVVTTRLVPAVYVDVALPAGEQSGRGAGSYWSVAAGVWECGGGGEDVGWGEGVVSGSVILRRADRRLP